MPHHSLGRSQRRTENIEAIESLKRIAVLQTILKDSADAPKKINEAIGFMLQSRFNNLNEDDVPKYREKQQKAAESEDPSIIESNKSQHTAESNHQISEKNRRYALSLATLANKPSKRILIVNEGAIQVLIEFAMIHDRTIQVRCSSAFASLSVEPSIRSKMLDDGALPVIISLATNVNIREVKVDCCRAICNLACVPGYEFKMLKEGVPFAVINIASACPETNETCLKILLNMSCVTEKLPRIEEITEALLHFADESLMYQEEVLMLQAFCNLSALRNNQLRLVEDGAFRIVEKYYRSRQPVLRRMACEILKNFTIDYRSRAKLIELNILATIVEMASDLDEEIRMQSAKCFLFLSKDHNFRRKITMNGGDAFSLIMQTCQVSNLNIDIAQVVSKTLRILCADSELTEKLIEEGIGKSLKNLMSLQNAQIHQLCVESLCELFRSTDAVKAMILDKLHHILVQLVQNIIDDARNVHQTNQVNASAGSQSHHSGSHTPNSAQTNTVTPGHTQLTSGATQATDPSSDDMCEMMEKSFGMAHSEDFAAATALSEGSQNQFSLTADAIQFMEWVSFSLFQIISSYACATRTIEERLLPCLLSLCSLQASSVLTLSFASAAIAVASSMTKVDCSSAIPMLVKMLQSQSSSQEGLNIPKFCAIALFNLSNYEANCDKIFAANALSSIVQLTQSTGTKVICAGIISRLSLHKRYYSLFSSKDVLKTLLELSGVDDRLTQRRVVIALSNLSQDDELRQKLLELNPIPYIVSLAAERDEYLRRGCISIVCNMSSQPGGEKTMVNNGIIPTLMITSLITTDQVISRIICVKALVNLMADSSLYPSMIKDGAIWALSKLGLMGDEELMLLCAKALCRLSCGFARAMLTSAMTVRTVLNFLKCENMSLKKPGARILTNLLLETKESDESFRQEIVVNMHPIAGSNDEELNELCVICLCLASQSDSCRSTIVSSGMLKRIDPSAIFSSDKTISFAYISMFSNIANDPLMRNQVLDNQLISRLKRILLNRDMELIVAAIKALYCVSCDRSNIPKLVDQQAVEFIESIIEENVHVNEQSQVTHYLLACLFNFSTHEDVAQRLVSLGIVRLLIRLWDIASKDVRLARLAILTVCHLCSAKTNTKQMVIDGCTDILCSILSVGSQMIAQNNNASYISGASNNATVTLPHPAPADLFVRVTAAFRNLLTVVSNQSMMIQHGCLPVLIQLANMSSNRPNPVIKTVISTATVPINSNVIASANVNGGTGNTNTGTVTNNNVTGDGQTVSAAVMLTSLGNSSNNVHGASGVPSALPNAFSSLELFAMKLNCAAALRSLTFNQELRHTLVDSEAIAILMAEIRQEDDLTSMSNGLLKELEAESWDNGGRGKMKEGRAKFIAPYALYTDLLRGSTTVQLNVAKKDIELEKYHVQVQLDDDANNDSADEGELPVNRRPASREKRGANSLRKSSLTLPGRTSLHKESSDDSLNSTSTAAAPAGGLTSAPSSAPSGSRIPMIRSSSIASLRPVSPQIAPDSPRHDSPTMSGKSMSFHRNKLYRIVTQANLVAQSEEENQQNAGAPSEVNQFEALATVSESDLSVEQLNPCNDQDEALGLLPARYPKQDSDVEVDTVALIRLDSFDTAAMTTGQPNILTSPATSVNNALMHRDAADAASGALSCYDDQDDGQDQSPVASGRLNSMGLQARETSLRTLEVKQNSEITLSLPSRIQQQQHQLQQQQPLQPSLNKNVSQKITARGAATVTVKEPPLPPMESITIPDISQHLRRKVGPDNGNTTQNSLLSQSSSLPMITGAVATGHSSRPPMRTLTQPQRDEVEVISNIVMLIKTAKDAQDSKQIDTVLDKWKGLSRY